MLVEISQFFIELMPGHGFAVDGYAVLGTAFIFDEVQVISFTFDSDCTSGIVHAFNGVHTDISLLLWIFIVG